MLSRTFLTVKDVAELLKVGEVTVRHWIREGDLRAIDLGREWRIAPTDLEDFLQRHETVGRRHLSDPFDQTPFKEEKSTRDQIDQSPDPDEGKR